LERISDFSIGRAASFAFAGVSNERQGSYRYVLRIIQYSWPTPAT